MRAAVRRKTAHRRGIFIGDFVLTDAPSPAANGAVFGPEFYRMGANGPLISVCVIWTQPDKFCLGGAGVFSVDSGPIEKKKKERPSY